MGVAQTGTGKTAAYVLPLLMKIKYAQDELPRALILVPTRELALQVHDQVKALSKYTDLRTVAVFGGTGMKPQAEAIAAGIDIIIATPGRLLDLYREGKLVLKKLQMFVMDEAERLLEMGFNHQLQSILDIVPRKRQNILFSATMSDRVKRIASDFLDMPSLVEITPEIKTLKNISQSVYFVPNLKTKINLLEHLLRDETVFAKAIVFCKTKNTANNIYKYFVRKFGEENVRVIHGNKDQNTRINSINSFRDGKIRFLIATDVAARGIDVLDVSHVINFDVPIIHGDYIHRIGRTGRNFKAGDSITFCSPNDVHPLKQIEKLIGQKIPVAEIPADVVVEQTPQEEMQMMLREIDAQKKKENPEYQGAFHEKKNKIHADRSRSGKGRGK
jgi:ATP-dependent RNA helicase RhlE